MTRRRLVILVAMLAGLVLLAGCGSEDSTAAGETNPMPDGSLAADIWGRIVPAAGTQTAYGTPLSFGNTQRFIDWYNTIALTPAQEAVKAEALSGLVAPCCDEYPAATCCCECNLSRSVWGLCAYLIKRKGYTFQEVRDAAVQWLHFIRPDYYVAAALVAQGRDASLYGISTESSCFTDRCELPFYARRGAQILGGCGGMDELVPMRTVG
jgi:hypothetical protein